MARKYIKNIQKELSALIDQMTDLSSMLRGSYGVAYRRCGKPNCRCAENDSKAHPFFRLSWTENEKQYTRNIPDEDREWIKEQVENHKLYKKNKRKIISLHKNLCDRLVAMEKEMTAKTKRERSYLS